MLREVAAHARVTDNLWFARSKAKRAYMYTMASPDSLKDGTVRECVSLAELVICLRSSGRGRKKYVGEAKNKDSLAVRHIRYPTYDY